MRSFPSFHISAQICFASAALCLFTPFREGWQMFAALAALMLLAVLAAARVSQVGVRLLLGLLPALALFLAADLTCLIAGVLLAAYGMIIIAMERFIMEVWMFRREAVWTFFLCMVIALLSNLRYFRSAPSRGFVAACVILTVLALRALRMQSQSTVGWELGNLGLLAFPAAGGALIGMVLWACYGVIGRVVSLVGILFSKLTVLWTNMWSEVMAPVETAMEGFPGEASVVMPSLFEMDGLAPTAAPLPESNFRFSQIQKPGKWVFAVLAGAAILALVFWLVRREKKIPRMTAVELTVEAEEDDPAPVKRRRRSRRAAMTNRDRIRGVYREYLAYLYRRGVRVKPSSTTADISESAVSLLHESDDQLRTVYRCARYDMKEPDDKAVAEAREALVRLISEPNRDVKT